MYTPGQAAGERVRTSQLSDGVPDAVRVAMADLVRTSHMSGLSIAVVRSTGVVMAGGHGVADLRTGGPAGARTAYPWFSMSKLATATAAMRLADEGRLDLRASVDTYLPWLPGRAGRPHPSTLQLLTHTSGLRNPVPVRWVHAANRPAPSSTELLVRLLQRPGAYRRPGGERAAYSNVGYLLAGEVVAALSRVPFEAYVRQAVLEPLGMNATGYTYRSVADAATGYVRSPRIADPIVDRLLPAGVPAGRHGTLRALNPFYVDGAPYGGLVGDVLDAGRFAQMHLGDGELDGRRVLSPQTTREMRRVNHHGRRFDHGIGWFRRPAEGAAEWVEHFGAGAGFWNVMRLYPGRDLGIVVMANSTAPYDFGPLFREVVRHPWP